VKTFLFSIDFEEFAAADPQRSFRCTAMSELLTDYLRLLRRHQMHATFFVVGSVARKYPDLVRRIVDDGHELGCHTDTHDALGRLTPETLRTNLERNIESLAAAGASAILGFRAPIFSLTPATQWAYPVLESVGLRYSSSVLAARNPLYGWPEFGTDIRCMGGITEVPVTLHQIGPLRIPIFGGTYFRLAPSALVRAAVRSHSHERPIVGFFHPYDIDTRQQWVMNAGVNGNLVLNQLLYLKRGSVLRRLESMLDDGVHICTYWEYLCSMENRTPA
jgi:peptidoglycan-N-acetylglucosamine deacetylase